MILGIDIGIQGAVAVLDQSGALVAVHDMPTLQDGPAGRRAVNAPLLASIIFASHATVVFVESVNARPGEGPTGAFAFGRARGVIEGVLAARRRSGMATLLRAMAPETIWHGRFSQPARRWACTIMATFPGKA